MPISDQSFSTWYDKNGVNYNKPRRLFDFINLKLSCMKINIHVKESEKNVF